jgi:ketosteroid isomerase-like protein
MTAVTHTQTLARFSKSLDRTGEPDWSLIGPDFEIHDHELPDSAAHRGREGWNAWAQAWREAFPDFSIERTDQAELDEQRIVTVHRLRARGRASGLELERIDAQVWTFEGGRLARMDYYPNYDPAQRTWSPPGAGPRSVI